VKKINDSVGTICQWKWRGKEAEHNVPIRQVVFVSGHYCALVLSRLAALDYER
jgi:hypothetical protein